MQLLTTIPILTVASQIFLLFGTVSHAQLRIARCLHMIRSILM